jgi:hypothetical protein
VQLKQQACGERERPNATVITTKLPPPLFVHVVRPSHIFFIYIEHLPGFLWPIEMHFVIQPTKNYFWLMYLVATKGIDDDN